MNNKECAASRPQGPRHRFAEPRERERPLRRFTRTPCGGLRVLEDAGPCEGLVKKSTTLFWCLFLALFAQGQSTFMNYYYGFGTAQFDLNELGSGNLLVGIAQESGTSVMDPLGNILHSQCYAIDTFVALQSVKRHTDNEFAFVGAYWKDPCAVSCGKRFYQGIGHMDS